MLRFLSFFFLFVLSFLVLGLLILAVFVLPTLPNLDNVQNIQLQLPMRIYSANDSLIAEFGTKRRAPVDIENVPQKFILAFVAAEDDRFYKHPGVDWQGLARAASSLLRKGDRSQGGSTITMQLARGLFLTPQKTYTRKIKEIILALQIESRLNKDQIMELYLNKITFGNRAYGIEAAANIYYGRSVQQLDLAQMTTLTGLIPRPSEYNPVKNPSAALNRRHYVLRRMLDKGFITPAEYDEAYNKPITAALHKKTVDLQAPWVAEIVRQKLYAQLGDSIYTNGLIVKTTIQDKTQLAANRAVRENLTNYDRRHGYRGPEGHTVIPENADEKTLAKLLKGKVSIGSLHSAIVLEIHTNYVTAFVPGLNRINIPWEGLNWARPYINPNLKGRSPKSPDKILKVGDIIRVQENADGLWTLTQIPAIEGALVSVDPHSGALLALVGGYDFQHSSFNRAIQAKRQPGSSIKPFLYSAALAAGETVATVINDAPVVYETDSSPTWRPKNYNQSSRGPMRLRDALIRSQNLVSVRLLEKIGISWFLEHLEKFGIRNDDGITGLSLALGSLQVSPMELARAYSVFANGGYLVDNWFIESIKTHGGKVIQRATPRLTCPHCPEEPQRPMPEHGEPAAAGGEGQSSIAGESPNTGMEPTAPKTEYAPLAIDPRNAWIMGSLTRDVVRYGTGRKALSMKRTDIGGKTGTSNKQRDAWFAGFNYHIVTICWVGFDDFSILGKGETGSSAALPMWIGYMGTVLDGSPESIMPRPEGLVNIKIDRTTGLRTDRNGEDTMFEVFFSENVPKQRNESLSGDDPATTLQTIF
ncbi:MAG: penicillin-binding protein 1A [Candidatus Eutrophobiaceae bacterium]